MKKLKEFLAKLRQKWQSLVNRFKPTSETIEIEPATPTPVKPIEVVVEVPNPPVDDVFARNPGLRGWLGSDSVKPVDYGPGAGGAFGNTLDGFHLTVKNHPYSNKLEAGKRYTFTVNGIAEVTLLEVVGTPDGQKKTVWVHGEKLEFGRHGKFFFSGGTFDVEVSESGYLGVQIN